MKTLKKFFCVIAFVLSVLCLNAFAVPKLQANAAVPSETLTFEISNGTTGFDIKKVGETETHNFLTANDAFAFALENLNSSKVFAISLKNLNVSETLVINIDNKAERVYVSGEIASNGFDGSLVCISGNQNATVLFEDITLTASSDAIAILCENQNAIISFGGNISCSSKLANAGVGKLSTHSEVTSAQKLLVQVPAKQNMILTSNFSDGTLENNQTDHFEFVTSADFYSISTSLINDNIISTATIQIEFDANGGNFLNGYTPQTELENQMQFADANSIAKEHFDYAGWFGKINFGGTTLYFDKTMLQNFLQSESGNPNDFFSTSIDNLDNNESFSGYNSETNNSHIELFLKLNTKPTFVAKWTDTLYTISFETNAEPVSDLNLVFGSEIVLPSISKSGFAFEGWFTDPEFEIPFSLETMPDHSFTLYAKWSEIKYTLTFMDSGTKVFETSLAEDEDITLFVPDAKKGMHLEGWFTNLEMTEQFALSKMPAQDVVLYAKWTKNVYNIYINSKGGQVYSPLSLEYGDSLSLISVTPPTKTGYQFEGWFTNSDCTTTFVFEGTMPDHSFTIYAKWQPLAYRLSFKTYSNAPIQPKYLFVNEQIELPTPENRVGKRFVGWYLDEECTQKFSLTVMPAHDILVYAKWNDKQVISIDRSVQTYFADDTNFSFNNFSTIQGFTVEYKIGDVWTVDKPTKIGTYDIRISRGEDDTYAAFETIISGGLVLTGTEINLTWLIIVLFIMAGLELIAIVVIKNLIRMKRNMSLAAVTMPIFSYLLPKSQFLLLIVAGVLALVLFIFLIYEIVVLHRTLPIIKAKKTENQPALSTSSSSQNASVSENLDGQEVEVKSISPIGTKYSESDIEALLENDDFREKHSTNTNNTEKVEKTYQSAIDIAKARSIDEKFAEDASVDDVEIQDKNGQKDFKPYISKDRLVSNFEFDNWQEKSQSDIPDDAK